MAKKKNGTAPFEVISRAREKQSKTGMEVPTWMGPTEEPSAQPPVEEASGASAVPPRRPEPFAPPPVPERPVAAEPMVSTSGGRLRLSLNYVSCMVIFLAFVLVVAGAFALGHYTAGSSEGPMKAGLGPAGGPGNGSHGVDPNQPGTGGPTTPTKRTKGKHYLVIQNLMGMTDKLKAEAFDIQEFCKANGQPATVNKLWKKYYIVWSLRPFDSPSDPQALTLAREIEELGKGYAGRWHFEQQRDGKFDPMFIREP